MKNTAQELTNTAKSIRRSIIEMIVPKETHHIGCSLDIVEILVSLYFKELNVNPKKPVDPGRDIFILSKGHAGAAVYATLAQRGFFDKSTLKKYDVDGGLLPEHITRVVPGIEVSTGSLGHGLPIGAGFALSFQKDKKGNRVFALLSDGELDEGSNWEAILFAGHHKLNNLVAIVDYNHFQGYGKTDDILNLEPLADKFKSFHWNVYQVDGHNFDDLEKAYTAVKKTKNNKPHVIIAKTVKGKGVPEFEGKFESHYHSISEELKQELLKKL